MFVITSFILNAAIGFNLPWRASYITAGVLTIICGATVIVCGKEKRK